MSKPRNAAVNAAAIGVLVTMAGGVWVVLVLPNFVNTLNEFKSELPLPSRVVLAVANLPEVWPPLVVGVGILAALAVFMVLRIRVRW